jgi:DNA-directed RNA polymerase subunit M/transcription elongation factor TFIIS
VAAASQPLNDLRILNLCGNCQERTTVKIAKTADRKKVMDTSKSTDCPKCGKPTRIVKRVKDRERGIPGGVFISCSGCEFYEKL